MKTLAIEQSTRTSSVALLDGDARRGPRPSPGENERRRLAPPKRGQIGVCRVSRGALPAAPSVISGHGSAGASPSREEGKVSSVVCERCWHNEALRNQAIFTVIPELLSEADWQMEDVELFAIDLGPGSFAGVRTALAASEGFAMVDRKPIVGVGSGEAIAADLFEEGHEGPIAVVGDARRHRFWVAVFEQGKKSPHPALPYTLTTAVELKETLKRVKTVATPEWDRIGELLSRMVGPSTELIKEPRVPSAATVGYLAMAAYLPATIAPLPQPIYLHPAVFVKPKYGKTAES